MGAIDRDTNAGSDQRSAPCVNHRALAYGWSVPQAESMTCWLSELARSTPPLLSWVGPPRC